MTASNHRAGLRLPWIGLFVVLTSIQSPMLFAQSGDTARRPVSVEPLERDVDLEARIRGALVLPGGGPAPETTVLLFGMGRKESLIGKGEQGDAWKHLSTKTDAKGAFEFRFTPPAEHDFLLLIQPLAYCGMSSYLSSVEEGEVHDVGSILLREGGTIEVTILDAEGAVETSEWDVSTSPGPRSGSSPVNLLHPSARWDPSGGWVRIRNVPPGSVTVHARNRLGGELNLQGVEVRAGETRTLELRNDGPDLSRRIVLRHRTRPFHSFRPPATAFIVQAHGQEPRRGSSLHGLSTHVVFDDLEPGSSYEVRLEHPSFQHWSRKNVAPGTALDAEIIGSSAIALEVVDAENGADIEHYSLRLRIEGVNFRPDEFDLVRADERPPADGVIAGLIPHDYTLLLEVPGFPLRKHPIRELLAGEKRRVRVEVGRSNRIAGRLVSSDGLTPMAGTRMELYHPEVLDQRVKWWRSFGDGSLKTLQVGWTTTDAEGRFEFRDLGEDPLLLRAVQGPGLHVLLPDVKAAASDGADGLLVRAQPAAWIEGGILLPEGASAECFRVLGGVDDLLGGSQPAIWMPEWGEVLEVDPDPVGSYRIGPFPFEGSGRVRLVLARTGLPPGKAGWAPSILVEDELFVCSPGVLRHDFDLRERFPGELRLDVSVGGRPAAGAQLRLAGGDPTSWQSAWIQAKARPNGSAFFQPFPGEYTVRVSSKERAWCISVPERFTVRAGEVTRARIEVPVAPGRVLVLDGDSGSPLREAGVRLYTRSLDAFFAQELMTDQDGWLAASYPEGTVWIQRSERSRLHFRADGEDLEALPSLEWTKVGPAMESITLPD